FVVSATAPPEFSYLPNGDFSGTYLDAKLHPQFLSGVAMQGFVKVQALTILPAVAALPGADGRDYVPFLIESGQMTGISPILGGAFSATFRNDLLALGAPIGMVVEGANGKSGFLDLS